MTRKRRTWLLGLTCWLGVCLPMLAGDHSSSHFFSSGIKWDFAIPQTMKEKLKELAGEGAMNCGRVRVAQDPTLATTCGQKAIASKKSFYVRYDAASIDSEVANGFSFDGDSGTAHIVTYLRPIGSYREERLTTVSCSIPVKVHRTKAGFLTCSLNYSESEYEVIHPLEQYN